VLKSPSNPCARLRGLVPWSSIPFSLFDKVPGISQMFLLFDEGCIEEVRYSRLDEIPYRCCDHMSSAHRFMPL